MREGASFSKDGWGRPSAFAKAPADRRSFSGGRSGRPLSRRGFDDEDPSGYHIPLSRHYAGSKDIRPLGSKSV